MEYDILNGYNLDINEQISIFKKIILSSKVISEVLERVKLLDLDNYYIGAGCITQTVWNYLSKNPLDFGIKDIDFVYFDEKNLDYESENDIYLMIKKLYANLNIEIDVKNQARVHLWYKSHFGYEIAPYKSLESAINTWPTTATSIGIRKNINNIIEIYAPFGFNDLFGKIVRANKAQITKQIYDNKVNNWLKKWSDLKIIPWEN